MIRASGAPPSPGEPLGSMVTCEEDEAEYVCAGGVLPADGPRVEVGRVSHLARPRVRCVLVAGVFEHGAVLLDGRLEEEKHSAVRLLERPLIRR